MEQPLEFPECPVCLQPYDVACTIPRVLSCGHSCCESCLSNLPKTYRDVIRCPACTVLITFPTEGPASLPKNFDLLRLVSDRSPPEISQNPVRNDKLLPLFPQSWSSEFYSTWSRFLLENDAIEREKVSLFSLRVLSDDVHGGNYRFKVSYSVKVINCLSELGEEERAELGFLLRVGNRLDGRICRVLGLYGDLEGNVMCLVCERKMNGTCLDELDELDEDEFSSSALIGMEMCEMMIGLHGEGLIAGCVGFSCFQVDEFGHVLLDLCRLLEMGRTVHRVVGTTLDDSRRIGQGEMEFLLGNLVEQRIFVSPEVLIELLQNKEIGLLSCAIKYCTGFMSDVWVLGCVLLRLLVGQEINDELVGYMLQIILRRKEDNHIDCSEIFTSLTEKVKKLWDIKWGSEFLLQQHILCKCLDFNPDDRPLLRNIWRCFKELVVKSRFEKVGKLADTCKVKAGCCLVLGKLCHSTVESRDIQEEVHLEVDESVLCEDSSQTICAKFVDDITKEKLKSKDIHGHLGCVTGLAVGGGFLVSSAFDKSVKVWSLQDLTLVHTFKGHESKVTAMIFVDGKEPKCISADSEGGIFVWSLSIPLQQVPLRKWYEQKDWRYSGVHALTFGGNELMYTGSGDRTIKGWSLQDGTLSLTMTGHKSVVSTLAVCNGVLYSGSYDGTIRLWSLSNHSLLTVLGGDTAGAVNPILSLFVNQKILVAGLDNGSQKVWKNDRFMKTIQTHNRAVFAIAMEQNFLFSGGWDKTVNIQELAGDEFELDPRPVGSVTCDSAIKVLLCHQGKLFVGLSDRIIKVFYRSNHN